MSNALGPLAVSCLLLALLVAGCATPEPAAPVAVDPVAELLGVENLAPANATTGLDTPILLSAQAGPDAPLTAFVWTVPEGAIREYEPIPGFDYTVEEVTLDLVPVSDDLELDEYAILVYSLGRTANSMGGIVATPTSGYAGDLLGRTPVETPTQRLESQLLHLSADGLDEGDQVAFVIAARSDEARPFGLLVAVADEETEDPSEDAADLLDERLAIPLEASGHGSGFQFALYLQFNLVFPPTASTFELRTPAIQVTDGLPDLAEPAVVARDRVVEAQFPTGGHTEAVVFALAAPLLTGACPEAGTFAIESDLHGTTTSLHNLLLGSGPTILATGLPIYIGTASGPGQATTRLEIRKVAACGIDLMEVFQMDLGATLEELTGVPAKDNTFVFEGLAGDIPPAWAAGGDLVLAPMGIPLRLLGAAQGLPDGPIGTRS
ncbi:MAG: hypothetical protein ACYC2H_04175 [Thermoplasmatota archaeon]